MSENSTTKIYKGYLELFNYGEEEILSFKGDDVCFENHLLSFIEDDMSLHGNFLSVRYYVSNHELSEERLLEEFLKNLYGFGDVIYDARYSETTGYLWTDEDLRVGGHDLLSELRSNIGKYLWIEIKYTKDEPIETRYSIDKFPNQCFKCRKEFEEGLPPFERTYLDIVQNGENKRSCLKCFPSYQLTKEL